jgi:hypothetical protein
MYTPRVVGLVVGQKLEIRNLDPTFHNVRGNLATKILWNLGQAKGAPAIVRDNLGQPGDVVSLHCDVHPWMSAWVAIHDHPHFAVTGADGGFTLPDLAPGTYTVEAWHPTLGTKTSKLKVRRGKTTKASFTFAAPPAPPPTASRSAGDPGARRQLVDEDPRQGRRRDRDQDRPAGSRSSTTPAASRATSATSSARSTSASSTAPP